MIAIPTAAGAVKTIPYDISEHFPQETRTEQILDLQEKASSLPKAGAACSRLDVAGAQIAMSSFSLVAQASSTFLIYLSVRS